MSLRRTGLPAREGGENFSRGGRVPLAAQRCAQKHLSTWFSRDDLKDLLLQSKPNDRVIIEVQRDGKTVKLTVKLGRKASKSKE